MEGVGWISWIIIGIIAGWIAEKVMDRSHGLFTNFLVGVIGAVLGGWLARTVGIEVAPGWIGSLIVATIGAIILLFLLGVFFRKR
ncbi:GlsB/YeaQ/YmgE family stress response membrane protein [Rhodoligotrophos defluvii]|uniref:GlsB/YeaQ/YmgE family stress response membrane protein n=1 Tax=Rhodoligotrophos defluvii TaxID=2561934 RepID=UPI0010C943C4|nr:GlsB/YeaQ/YmgE family stress response membrane protein [Rhodoligotrophos defluvii]